MGRLFQGQNTGLLVRPVLWQEGDGKTCLPAETISRPLVMGTKVGTLDAQYRTDESILHWDILVRQCSCADRKECSWPELKISENRFGKIF